MSSRDALYEELVNLRGEEGATPERLRDCPLLLQALGTTDAAKAREYLEAHIKTIATDAANTAQASRMAECSRVALNSFGYGPSTKNKLSARREEMRRLLNEGEICSLGTIKNRETTATNLLINRLEEAAGNKEIESGSEPPALESAPRTFLDKWLEWPRMVIPLMMAIVLAFTVVGAHWAYTTLRHHDAGKYKSLDVPRQEFLALSTADQIDACYPYVADHMSDAFRHWQTSLRAAGSPISQEDDLDPKATLIEPSQVIIDRQVAIIQMSVYEPNKQIATNILSCALDGPLFDDGASKIEVNRPLPHRMVVDSSGNFTGDAKFMGVTANGSINRILEVENNHCQIMFGYRTGHDPDHSVWLQRAFTCDKNSMGWAQNLREWK